MDSVVVFPAPLCPSSTAICPSNMFTVRSRTACRVLLPTLNSCQRDRLFYFDASQEQSNLVVCVFLFKDTNTSAHGHLDPLGFFPAHLSKVFYLDPRDESSWLLLYKLPFKSLFCIFLLFLLIDQSHARTAAPVRRLRGEDLNRVRTWWWLKLLIRLFQLLTVNKHLICFVLFQSYQWISREKRERIMPEIQQSFIFLHNC